jgi:hypothetical protein
LVPDTIYVATSSSISSIELGTLIFVGMGAVSTLGYAIISWRGIKSVKEQVQKQALQIQEQMRLTQATILHNVYELVRATRGSREKVYRNQTEYKSIHDVNSYRSLRDQQPELYEAFKEATNCNQYIGVLIQHNLIDKDIILDESYTTIARLHEIVGHLVKLEQEELGNTDYKKPYMDLAEAATRRWETETKPNDQNSSNI